MEKPSVGRQGGDVIAAVATAVKKGGVRPLPAIRCLSENGRVIMTNEQVTEALRSATPEQLAAELESRRRNTIRRKKTYQDHYAEANRIREQAIANGTLGAAISCGARLGASKRRCEMVFNWIRNEEGEYVGKCPKCGEEYRR